MWLWVACSSANCASVSKHAMRRCPGLTRQGHTARMSRMFQVSANQTTWEDVIAQPHIPTKSRGRQRLRPPVRQLCGRPGRLEHGQDVLHRAAKRSCKAALRGALPGAGPAQPDGRNGGRLRPPDPGRNPQNRQNSGVLLKHEFLDGDPGRGAHHARQLPGALQQPEL